MLDETKENAKPEPNEDEKAVNDSKKVEQPKEDKVVKPKEKKAKKEEKKEVEPVPEKPKKVSKTSSKKTTTKKEVKKEVVEEKVTSKSTKKVAKSTPKKSSKEDEVKESVASEVKEDEVSEVVETVEAVEKKEKKPKAKKSAKEKKPIADEKSEEATKKSVAKPQEFPVKDYKAMNLEDLVTELEALVTDAPVNKIKDNVEALKSAFNTKFSAVLAEEKEIFIKGGGNSIDFYFSTPYKSKYNTLLGQFKKKRSQFYSQLEQQFQDNLKLKLDIIEALKELIDNAEVSTMYKSFKSLQERWRSVGPIPRNKYNDSWQTYHHHVERFYDLLHLSKDLRDLDFKHNLEEKEKLIAKAEALAKVASVDDAFKELQQLHKIWKEDIGPVQKEIREEVWQRFSNATKVIHDRRHDVFKELKVVFDENTAKKEVIIKEIAAFDTENLHSHSDWQNAIRSVEKLRDDFFKVGRVSRKQNEALWKNFKEATRTFNSGKNNFYKSIKQEQLDNLTKKRDLLSQAVALKDNEDLEGTVEVVKKIQADWKKIGHVPRKYSDKIWKEFKEACNSFFDRYHEVQNEDSKEEVEAFKNKKTFLEDLKSKAKSVDFKPSLEEVKGFVKEWKTLGFVPASMRHVEAKFNKFLEKQLESLKLGKSELVMLKFKIMIDGYKAANDTRKLDSEQIFLRKKIDEISKEMQQLDNNMNFFSNTSDDNPLLKKVKKDIQKHQDDLGVLKEKLAYIRRA